MDLGTVIVAPCVNAPPPPDNRCLDEAFRLANPDVCPVEPFILIKPSVGIVCAIGSIQFKTFLIKDGSETEITSGVIYKSSDLNVFLVGAISGNGTGLQSGSATISATYNDMTAYAEVSVLEDVTAGCCASLTTAMVVLLDNSRSMSLAFNSNYGTKLSYAKKAAKRFIEEVNETKDLIGLITFNDFETQVLSVPVSDKADVSALLPGIAQTQQKTSFYNAINAAIAELDAVTADRKVIVLISDGEDSSASYTQDNNPISVADNFKSSGGIIMALGVRSHGAGYSLLSALATGGFFINAHNATAAISLDYLSGIKGYVQAGNCTPEGDEIVGQGALNFADFTNWDVLNGYVDLQGNDFFDYLPGNGLYVDLISGAQLSGEPNPVMQLKTALSLVAGKNYRFTAKLAGNQVFDNGAGVVRVKVFSSTGGNPTVYLDQSIVINDFKQPFKNYSFAFSMPASDDVLISIQQTESVGLPTPTGGQRAGIILGDVLFENVTDVETVFHDDFDEENPTYIAPKCGVGTTPLTEVIPGTPALEEIPDPPAQENGDPCGTDTFGAVPVTDGAGEMVDTEYAAYYVTYVTAEGETSTNQTQASIAQILTPDNAMRICWPPITDPRIIAVRVWRNFTEFPAFFDAAFPLANPNMRMLVELDPSETSYLDTVPNDTWYAASSGDTAPTENTTAVEGTEDQIIDTYGYGYCCYGEGCLSEPPVAQTQDPAPLPNIESGYTPPKVFSSTKQVCLSCQPGYRNISTTNLVAVMTANDAPTGEVAADGEEDGFEAWKAFDNDSSTYWKASGDLPHTLQYQFAAAKTAAVYSVECPENSLQPQAWALEGSNDGETWAIIDSRLNILFYDGEKKFFTVTTPGSYLYYRLNISESPGSTVAVSSFEIFAAAPTQVCKSADGESEISQSDADAQATAAATALAQAELNCLQLFSSTQQFTANCPAGQFGSSITKTKSATSLNSQDEADATALALAQDEAEALLDCTGSNNDEKLTILDGEEEPTRSAPYPGVKYVSGLSGVITKVTVDLKRFNHGNYADVHAILVSPSGTAVYLIGNCMDAAFDTTERNITADDDAADSIPEFSRPAGVDHTYKPTLYGPQIDFPTPAPAGPYGTTLADFIGEDPNGSWALYVIDDTFLDEGFLNEGWDLTIVSA